MTNVRIRLTRLGTLSLLILTLSACETVTVAEHPRSQWEDLPSALTEPPQTREFLKPYSDIVTRHEELSRQNDENLLCYFDPASCKPKP